MMDHYNNLQSMKQRDIQRAALHSSYLRHARDRYYAVYEKKYFECTTEAQRMLLREFSLTHSPNALSVHLVDEAAVALQNYNPLAH